MCGRYYRKSDKQKLVEAFHLDNPSDLLPGTHRRMDERREGTWPQHHQRQG